MTEVQSEAATAAPSELVAAGRRHLAVRDFSSAASALADACEALAKEHGEAADQCAEAYLWYGKALLGLSREESGVLGDGVPGADNAEEEEDDNDEQEENGEAEAVEENGKSEAEAKTNGESEKSKAPATTQVEAATSTSEAEPAETNVEPGTSNGFEEGNSELADLEEEEVDNLQLAWEMLELARSILERRSGPAAAAARGPLAEAHLALGEVALESETYDKAVVDMMRCLELQKQLYPAADRRLAETHYQIGLANSLASNFEDAITHFKNAANILESRIKALEEAGAGAGAGEGEGQAEVRELRALLPEIQEKIADTADCRAETIKRLREQLCPSNGGGAGAAFPSSVGGAGGAGGAGGSSSAGAAAAADISHLIKRKRKPSEGEGAGAGGEAPAAKRANT